MEHRELSTKEVAEILNLSAPYVTALVKKGKLKAHPRQSGGWCGNPGYGYFYQDVMEYQKQRAAGRRGGRAKRTEDEDTAKQYRSPKPETRSGTGRKKPKVRQADPALLTELKAALEDFQAARVLLDEQAERLKELAAKLLKEGE